MFRFDSVLAGLVKGTVQRWNAFFPIPKCWTVQEKVCGPNMHPRDKYVAVRLTGTSMQAFPKTAIKAVLWTLCAPLITLADISSTQEIDVVKGDLTTALSCSVPLLQPYRLFDAPEESAAGTSKGKGKKKSQPAQYGFEVINAGMHSRICFR